MREKRSKIQRRKQMIFLLMVMVVCVGSSAYYLWKHNQDDLSGEYKKSDQTDIVEYDGKDYEYNDHLSNYLFMGVDTRELVDRYEVQGDSGQADAIFLVSHDRVTDQITCLAIPRDTMAEIEVIGLDGSSKGMTKDHINIQYAFGDGKSESCELMREAVSKLLYQIPIQKYCSMNMDGISIMTDLVGGVEVTVPDNSLKDIDPTYTKGAQVVLTGDTAEQFVRYRDIGKSQSALVRMERQTVFFQAYLEKVKELGTKDISIIARLLDGVQDDMVTNMEEDQFVTLLEASEKKKMIMETLPGKGTEGEDFDEYHLDDNQLYEMILKVFYKEV